jgi:hypothetical protein
MVDTSVDEMDSNVKLALCRSDSPLYLVIFGLTKYRASEVTAGIICGNLPSLPAFIRHAAGKEQHGGMIEVDSRRIDYIQHERPSHPDKLPDMVFLAEARGEVV